MQYNQIPHSPSGQPANWRINISQMFSHRSESSESHARLPSLKVKYYEEEPPVGLWVKQGLHSLSMHTVSCTRKGEGSDLIGAWARATCWSWRVS